MARKAAADSSAPETALLTEMLDAAYCTTGWHGPTLRSTVARLKLSDAVFRPASNKHNIAEFVLHCAYWKYVGVRRLTGGQRGGFALKGSNWFAFGEDQSDQDWRAARMLLDEMHQNLIGAVEALSSVKLHSIPKGSKVTNLKLIYGLAAHDAYHAGQIKLIRGMR